MNARQRRFVARQVKHMNFEYEKIKAREERARKQGYEVVHADGKREFVATGVKWPR